jgi:c-di-GMP-binding flagellar brake protein YcgR
MDYIDVNTVKENDIVKFINPNKTLIDGIVKKVCNDCLGITINTRQEAFRELSKNQFIELILVHKHEALRCTSIVLGSTRTDFGQVVIISIPKLLLGIERREFQRIPIVMDIEYSPLPVDVDYKRLSNVEPRFFRALRKTYSIDISGGGVYVTILKNELECNFALMTLSLKNEKISMLCKKVRTDFVIGSNYNKVAFKYDDIEKNHRQLIIDFVSEKSKEMTAI